MSFLLGPRPQARQLPSLHCCSEGEEEARLQVATMEFPFYDSDQPIHLGPRSHQQGGRLRPICTSRLKKQDLAKALVSSPSPPNSLLTVGWPIPTSYQSRPPRLPRIL